MTVVADSNVRVSSVRSADGTPIGYCSVGTGPGLIIVGGVLSSAARYRPLAEKLTDTFEVHLMNRRGRVGSGPQGARHSIDQECDDLLAVMEATGAGVVFGHSFGGLVALETARRRAGLERVFVYEPGIPLHGHFNFDWLEGYERFLEQGDLRGAFAWMVKHAGLAPWPIGRMPLWYLRAVLRLAIGSRRWASIAPLLLTPENPEPRRRPPRAVAVRTQRATTAAVMFHWSLRSGRLLGRRSILASPDGRPETDSAYELWVGGPGSASVQGRRRVRRFVYARYNRDRARRRARHRPPARISRRAIRRD